MTDRRPLYVRLPTQAADTLDRVALERRISKQDLVTDLIVGSATFRPEPSEAMTLQETAALLQSTDDAVQELIDAGELPARKIGGEWRLSRAAVLNWLTCA